jgi:hypothetical protein
VRNSCLVSAHVASRLWGSADVASPPFVWRCLRATLWALTMSLKVMFSPVGAAGAAGARCDSNHGVFQPRCAATASRSSDERPPATSTDGRVLAAVPWRWRHAGAVHSDSPAVQQRHGRSEVRACGGSRRVPACVEFASQNCFVPPSRITPTCCS